MALEHNFKLKEERLRDSCTRQAGRLQQEHEEELKIELDQARVRHTEHTRPSPTMSANQKTILPPSSASTAATSNKETDEEEHSIQGETRRPSSVLPLPPPQPMMLQTDHLARNKVVVQLRSELAKHLAVAHEHGRNLLEATKVMRLLSEMENKARLEMEVGKNGLRTKTLLKVVLVFVI